MVPHDRFTPHGYLDNPYHTRNLNPSGVLRSLPGIGFAWHYPALPRSYGYRVIYQAGFRLYLVHGGRVLVALSDFPGLYASRHTKNELIYAWEGNGLTVEAGFFQVTEHTLACRARLSADEFTTVRLGAVASYRRHLGAAGEWGESGLVGRIEGNALVLQGFEDGEAFALASSPEAQWLGATIEADSSFLSEPVLDGDHVAITGHRGDSVSLYGAVALDLALAPHRTQEVEILLSRDIRRELAVARLERDRTEAPVALARCHVHDANFWRRAPQLEGDWPEHWRRGLVYDIETLRMMVRQPIGIYRYPWDAMQIQAPRVVLAEAAIDALLLSYADPDTAKELLLGTFLDALKPNVPCSREDGSFNMVGANGSECGTAPEWGYPLRVAAHLYDLVPDRAWLEALFPPLERFLWWWEEHRRDAAGYLVYDNSWESGQDLSARFGPQQEGGGSTIRAVHPVDLQAAMADACRIMARFARILGRGAQTWEARVGYYSALTEALWQRDSYRDFDTRVGWSDVWDVMQLAPVALDLAPPAHVMALRSRIESLAEVPYLWPMFVWTATDAALQAGALEVAAQIACTTIDRAYRTWDRRTCGPNDPLPGIACEYWGSDGRNGAEGYGWGAFGVHLLFRTLLGYRPCSGGFDLQPNLLPGWPDGSYGVRNFRTRPIPIDLILNKQGAQVDLVVTAHGGNLAIDGVRSETHVLSTVAHTRLRFKVEQ